MNTLQRIKQFIDLKGITNQNFEKEIGFSNGAFASQLRNNKTIGVDKLENILTSFPELNPNWLLTGKGEMTVNYQKSKTDNPISYLKEAPTDFQLKPTNQGIPIIPFEAFGGYGDGTIEGVNIETIQDRYVVPLFHGIKIDFMIPVRGSSMYPKYNSGDVVACRIINDIYFIQWNKVYVIDTISQGTVIKRLKKSDNSDNVICKSDNKDYDEFELPKSDIRTIAMVVGVIRIE